MTGEIEFSTADHLQGLREERRDRKKNRDEANDAKLGGIVNNTKKPNGCLILRAKNRGSWLTMCGTTVTVIVLAATEFRDFCAHVTM